MSMPKFITQLLIVASASVPVGGQDSLPGQDPFGAAEQADRAPGGGCYSTCGDRSESPRESTHARLDYTRLPRATETGSELHKLVFIIDGSGSIASETFTLQKEGVANSICGPNAFVPSDGTTAVAVIQFSTCAILEMRLTLVDSYTAEMICATIRSITQMCQETWLEPALDLAFDLFSIAGPEFTQYLMISTDGGVFDEKDALARCSDLRTMPAPVRICTALVGLSCPEVDEFLEACANAPWSDPPYPLEPTGMHVCVEEVEEYAPFCADCACTLVHPGGPDCNDNGVNDLCDIVSGPSRDCNTNDVPDECDINTCQGQAWCADCDANGVPDVCDPDCNENDIPDQCDIDNCQGQPWCADCTDNGIPDVCEPDCQPEGQPGSGTADSCDIDAGTSQDCDVNGVPDECDPDCDSDGTPDTCELAAGTQEDCNTNGIPDECDIASGFSLDCQHNEIPDECELDCNGNNVPDDCDIDSATSDDCNANGIPDECDIASCTGGPECRDCNANGVFDYCDIADGTSQDIDGNAVPDECQMEPPRLPGPPHDAAKHRYISIDATRSLPGAVAIKVEIAEMLRCKNDKRRSCLVDEDCPTICVADPDLHSCESGGICPDGVCIPSGPCGPHPNVGLSWYVLEPQTRGANCPNGMCNEDDWYARVARLEQHAPYVYASDWRDECNDPNWTGGCTTLHIGDCQIVPGVTYHVYACDPDAPSVCSVQLPVGTTRKSVLMPHYGDVAGRVTPSLVFTPPDGYTSVIDIGAYLLTLKNWGTTNLPQAHPTWIDLHGPGAGIPPQYIVNVTDVNMLLAAFVDILPYENTIGGLAPGDCP